MILYDDFIWQWDVMRTQWWLHSITGSYERTCDRGRIWGDYNSLHQGYLRDVSLRRVVGVSLWWITHVRHTRVNTSVGTVYDIFWFSWYKNLYVLCFKIYMYYKRNTGGLWLRLSPMMFRKGFRLPMSFKEKIIHRHIVVLFWVDIMYCYAYDTANLLNRFRLPHRSLGRFFICFFLHQARGFNYTLFSLSQVKHCPLLYAVVINSLSNYFSDSVVVFIEFHWTLLSLLWYFYYQLFSIHCYSSLLWLLDYV